MTIQPASQAQISYVRSLMGQKLMSEDLRERAQNVVDGTAYKAYASEVITELKQCGPRLAEGMKVSANPVTELGLYFLDGSVYKVVRSQMSNKLYAKKLDTETGNWNYDAGYFQSLNADLKLTQEQAELFGSMHNRCACCGAWLEDIISVAYFVGPVCSKKYFGITRSRSKKALAEAQAIIDARLAKRAEEQERALLEADLAA